MTVQLTELGATGP